MNELLYKKGWIPVERWINSCRRMNELLHKKGRMNSCRRKDEWIPIKNEWIPVEGYMNSWVIKDGEGVVYTTHGQVRLG